MKILVIGGHGTIGRKVAAYFATDHEVIIAGRKKGDVLVDLTDSNSIASLFENIGSVDAIISCAGESKWAPFNELTIDDFNIGLKSKLMGQVNLVKIGKDHLNPSGSITLTTGILADDPVRMTTSAALVNGGIHSFVKAVILELEPGIRVNVVAPGLVEDSREKYKDFFPGHTAVPMTKVVNGYVRSVLGRGNGEIIRVYS